MRRRTTVSLCIAATLALTGCSSTEEPTATAPSAVGFTAEGEAPSSAAPSAAPATRSEASSVRLAESLSFGESYDYRKDSEIDPTMQQQRGTMTVLEYRPSVAPDAKRPQQLHDYLKGEYGWSSLKARYCNDGMDVDEGEDDTAYLSAWAWALELADGSLATPFADELDDFPRPLYPTDDDEVRAGTCVTGNIIFAVPKSQQVVRALYLREGSLPVAWTDH